MTLLNDMTLLMLLRKSMLFIHKKAYCRLHEPFQESPEVLLQLLTPAWGREVLHYSLSSGPLTCCGSILTKSQPLRGLGFERSSSAWQRTCNLMGIEHDSGHRYRVKIRQVCITLSSRRNRGEMKGSYVLARLSLHDRDDCTRHWCQAVSALRPHASRGKWLQNFNAVTSHPLPVMRQSRVCPVCTCKLTGSV